MNLKQEKALRNLCRRYRVPFNPGDYHPQFDLPEGYVAGWIGGMNHSVTYGTGKPTLYVGCSPEGEISS
jgi:hypothetical protein